MQLRLPSLSSQYFVSKASYLVGMGGVREPIDPLSVDAQCPRAFAETAQGSTSFLFAGQARRRFRAEDVHLQAARWRILIRVDTL